MSWLASDDTELWGIYTEQREGSWRRRGDLNPRYGFTPYDSLANCWFKPLTHFSGGKKTA